MDKFDNRIKYVLDLYVDFIVKLFNSNPLSCCFGVFLLFVGFCIIPTIFVLIYVFKRIYDYINIFPKMAKKDYQKYREYIKKQNK